MAAGYIPTGCIWEWNNIISISDLADTALTDCAGNDAKTDKPGQFK